MVRNVMLSSTGNGECFATSFHVMSKNARTHMCAHGDPCLSASLSNLRGWRQNSNGDNVVFPRIEPTLLATKMSAIRKTSTNYEKNVCLHLQTYHMIMVP